MSSRDQQLKKLDIAIEHLNNALQKVDAITSKRQDETSILLPKKCVMEYLESTILLVEDFNPHDPPRSYVVERKNVIARKLRKARLRICNHDELHTQPFSTMSTIMQTIHMIEELILVADTSEYKSLRKLITKEEFDEFNRQPEKVVSIDLLAKILTKIERSLNHIILTRDPGPQEFAIFPLVDAVVNLTRVLDVLEVENIAGRNQKERKDLNVAKCKEFLAKLNLTVHDLME